MDWLSFRSNVNQNQIMQQVIKQYYRRYIEHRLAFCKGVRESVFLVNGQTPTDNIKVSKKKTKRDFGDFNVYYR